MGQNLRDFGLVCYERKKKEGKTNTYTAETRSDSAAMESAVSDRYWDFLGRCRSRKACRSRDGAPVNLMNGHDDNTMRSESLLAGLPDELALQCLARVPDLRLLRGVCKQWKGMIDTSSQFFSVRAEVGLKSIDWLYVLIRSEEGCYSWYAQDPMSSTWHALPPMPEEVDFQLTSPGVIGSSHQVQCVSTGRKLVMLTGLKHGTGDMVLHQWSTLEPALEHPWIFDPRKRMWKKGQRFGTPRRWCVCGVVDAKVYVASGCGLLWTMSLSKSTDVYDPEADTWESLPLTLNSSKFSGEAIPAVTAEGKMYMVSGRGMHLKVGAVFCSATRTWSKMPDNLRKGWIGSCVAVDDKIYVVDDWAGKLSVYETVENRWRVVLGDPRLKGLINPTAAGKGRICGVVEPSSGTPVEEGSCLRIINLNSEPPTILDLTAPQGRVISIQVLERMNLTDHKR